MGRDTQPEEQISAERQQLTRNRRGLSSSRALPLIMWLITHVSRD